MTPHQRNIVSFLVQLNLLVWGTIAIYLFVLLPHQDQIVRTLNTAALRQNRLPPLTPLPTSPAISTLFPTPQSSAGSKPFQAPDNLRVGAIVALTAPSGATASNALIPSDDWRWIDGGAIAWYRIGNGGVHMDVFLEAKPLSGMTMDIYAPDNLGRPIGQGTLQTALGRMTWSGGHWNATGDWLARLTNGNGLRIQYKLTSETRAIPKCQSVSYWEYIGKDLVYWTRCK